MYSSGNSTTLCKAFFMNCLEYYEPSKLTKCMCTNLWDQVYMDNCTVCIHIVTIVSLSACMYACMNVGEVTNLANLNIIGYACV